MLCELVVDFTGKLSKKLFASCNNYVACIVHSRFGQLRGLPLNWLDVRRNRDFMAIFEINTVFSGVYTDKFRV